MKNFIREGQKLPLFGIGPQMVAAMGAVALLGICLSGGLLRSGLLGGVWVWIFRIAGVILMAAGFWIWFLGAVRSDIDSFIAENRLKTDGIYAYVRNPMYTGWLFLIFGAVLLWHNVWLLAVLPVDWLIMTAVLIRTEEQWLLRLYGEEYEAYCRRVNRCFPWKRR